MREAQLDYPLIEMPVEKDESDREMTGGRMNIQPSIDESGKGG